ncbi:MAG: twin-arginine translocation signal domain-containing protein [Rhodothermales bacterium]
MTTKRSSSRRQFLKTTAAASVGAAVTRPWMAWPSKRLWRRCGPLPTCADISPFTSSTRCCTWSC